MNSEDSVIETLAALQDRAPHKPPTALESAVCAQCTKDLQPKRGLSRSARLALSALLGIGAVTLLWAVSGQGPGALSTALLGTAAWGGVLGIVLLLGLGTTGTCRLAWGARLALLITLPVAFCLGSLLFSNHVLPMMDFFGSSDHVRGILPCGSLSLGTGALVSGGIMLLWRRTDPFSPGLSGALVGLMGGLAGAIGVGFACPSSEAWHMCVGHCITLGALVTAGWLLGRRLLAP